MQSRQKRQQDPWLIVIARRTGGGLPHLRRVYGSGVQVSRLAGHNLIHLDHPDAGELRRRFESLSTGSLPLPEGVTQAHLSAGLDIIFLRRRSHDETRRTRSLRPELDGAGPGSGRRGV